MSTVNETENYENFRDCLSAVVIERLAEPRTVKSSTKGRSKGRKNATLNSTDLRTEAEEDDAADLSDFVEYLSGDIYASFPDDLRTISYAVFQNDPGIAEKYSTPLSADAVKDLVERIPPTISDSFCSYGLVEEPSELDRLLDPVFNNYVKAATAAPPEYTPELTAARPDGCEICGREHLPLTYHHLIPREIHAKAVKRGWHKEWQLNKVCWLCRACHSFVHRIATNEELARHYYDVELLLQREDVQKWAAWAARIRWKAR